MDYAEAAAAALSKQELGKLLDKNMLWLEAQVAEGATAIEPFLVVSGSTGTPEVQFVLFRISSWDEDRRATVRNAGEFLAGEGLRPVAAILTAEAWAVMHDAKALSSQRQVRPSQDPDRMEIVSLMGRTIDGRSLVAYHRIERLADGHIQLGELVPEHGFDSPGPGPDVALVDAFFEGVEAGIAKQMASARAAKPRSRLRTWLAGIGQRR